MPAPAITEMALREIRARRHDEERGGQRARPPLQYAFRHDFNRCAYPGGDVDLSVCVALESLDRNFEIIYDRSITPTDGSPGHALYRKLRNGGVESEDYFVLEFPLQWDCNMQWPHGRPRAPGMWVVDEVKKRMAAKDAFGGNTLAEATEKQVDAMIEGNEQNKVELDKKTENLNTELGKDFVTYAVAGKVSASFNPAVASTPHKRPRGRPKGSKNK